MKRKGRTPIPVKIVHEDAPSIGAFHEDKYSKWKIEDAMRNLERADEVRRDPRMMKEVKALASEKRASLDRIARLEKEKL
jgi:hypothetical protein